ncbi:MAG: lactate utilization protein [Betaproteobacteria bacterium]|nr:lactate utilization protein [Betaproteobacteria bacterium]
MQEKEDPVRQRNRVLSKRLIKNLQERKFDAWYCETADEAVDMALSLIPSSDRVSWGGSVTIQEIGLVDRIRQNGYAVIDRDTAKSTSERVEVMRQSLLCDTYLTSFNAVSEDGILVNVDNVGNRVAAIAFGPKSIVAVVGMNKVCKTLEAARIRARNIAAPINVQRVLALGQRMMTPCATGGSCFDCKTDDSICSSIVETRMSRRRGRIKIILVGESLGF